MYPCIQRYTHTWVHRSHLDDPVVTQQSHADPPRYKYKTPKPRSSIGKEPMSSFQTVKTSNAQLNHRFT